MLKLLYECDLYAIVDCRSRGFDQGTGAFSAMLYSLSCVEKLRPTIFVLHQETFKKIVHVGGEFVGIEAVSTTQSLYLVELLREDGYDIGKPTFPLGTAGDIYQNCSADLFVGIEGAEFWT